MEQDKEKFFNKNVSNTENLFDDSQNEKIQDNVSSIFDDEKSDLDEDLIFFDDFNFGKDFEKKPDEDLATTKKISLFEDKNFEGAIKSVEKAEKEEEKEKVSKPFSDKKAKKASINTMESAFINCSILGFITLFSGFGWLFWILNKVAN